MPDLTDKPEFKQQFKRNQVVVWSLLCRMPALAHLSINGELCSEPGDLVYLKKFRKLETLVLKNAERWPESARARIREALPHTNIKFGNVVYSKESKRDWTEDWFDPRKVNPDVDNLW